MAEKDLPSAEELFQALIDDFDRRLTEALNKTFEKLPFKEFEGKSYEFNLVEE